MRGQRATAEAILIAAAEKRPILSLLTEYRQGVRTAVIFEVASAIERAYHPVEPPVEVRKVFEGLTDG